MDDGYCRCTLPDFHGIPGGVLCYGCGSSPSLAGSLEPLEKTYGTAPHYRHKALIKPTDFRLIRLFPGRGQSPIVCHVLRFGIEKHPGYEAVSYTWGDQKDLKQIFTQSGCLSVTASCHAALSDLRQWSDDRYLWIDAVCINQSDNLEKNHQVPLMKQIYAKADRVLIHLRNTFSLDMRPLFDALRKGEPITHPDGQMIVSQFLSEPWFSRVWVLQEAAVSKSARVIMGPDALDWSYVSPGRLHVLGLQAVNMDNRIPPALVYNEGRPFTDLISLLNAARSCSSTDPRDRIYALMGLLKNPEDLELVADYDRPVEHVYAAVAKQAILNYNHLDILAEASHEPYFLRRAIGQFTHFYDLQRILQLRSIPANDLVLARQEVGYPGVESWMYAVRRVNESRTSQEQTNWTRKVRDGWNRLEQAIHQISTIPRTTGTAWSPSVMAVDRLYTSLGVSRTAEEKVIGKNALHSSFLTLGGYAYWQEPMSRTYHFSTRVERLPLRERALVRDALYLHHMAAEKFQNEYYEAKKSFLSLGVLSQSLPDMEEWQQSNKEEQILRLPSWVPDFQTHRALPSLAYWRPKVAEGSGTQANPPPGSDRAEDVSTLQVRVLKVDTLTDSAPQGGLPDSTRLEWKDPAGQAVRHDSASFFKFLSANFDQTLYGRPFEDVWEFRKCRRLCPTTRSFAIAPFSASASDGVYLLHGASVPFVLRAVPGRDDGAFELLGECYLHGCRGPTFAHDYLELLGDYRRHFSASTARDLPWETARLV